MHTAKKKASSVVYMTDDDKRFLLLEFAASVSVEEHAWRTKYQASSAFLRLKEKLQGETTQ